MNKRRRGAVSQVRVGSAVSQGRVAPSPSPSPSSSPSVSSFPLPSLNHQQLHNDGQRAYIGPTSDREEHNSEQIGQMRTECPSIPSSSVSPSTQQSPSVQQSNPEGGPEDSRFFICSYGDSFEDATHVVRKLNKIVNNYWQGPWVSCSSAPKEIKDLWWNEFKQKFSWDESEEDEIRRNFKKKTGDHIRNVMNKAKKTQVKPDFITGDDWTQMKTIWESEANKLRSEQNKKNRASASSEGSATYAGGSINIGEHRKKMASELGREPTYTATFKRTFQKKDKTWTSDRAKAIKEKYDDLLMSTVTDGDGGAASEPMVDDMALWVEASGGMKRGKIFGMRSLSRVYTAKGAASSSSSAAVSRRTRVEEQMTQELTQMRHLLVEKDEEMKVVKQQLSQKDEEIKLVNAQMQLIMQHLNLNQHQLPPVPPTNHIGDGHNDDQQNDDDSAGDDDDFVSRLIG